MSLLSWKEKVRVKLGIANLRPAPYPNGGKLRGLSSPSIIYALFYLYKGNKTMRLFSRKISR